MRGRARAAVHRFRYHIGMIQLTTERGGVLLGVKVVPGASRERIMGEWDGRLKIAVAAPPEKGKANQAVVALVAGLLGVKKNQVSVAAGSSSPVKTIRIEQVSAEAVRLALDRARS